VATLTLGGRSLAGWRDVVRGRRWFHRGRSRREQPLPPLRFVFVVTYGRSGSTLVQGLLNTIPRTLVRGENNLFIWPLYQSMVLVREFKRQFGGPASSSVTSAFYGLRAMRPAHFAAATRDLVVKQLLGPARRSRFDVIGFKEVQWHRIGRDEQADFFDFMDEAFPDAKYVLNRRRHEDVLESGFWQGRRPDRAARAVARVEEIQEHLRTTRPERIFDTRYEVLTGDDGAAVEKQLRGLAEFVVGSCDDALLSAMRETLMIGHGPNPFGASRGPSVTQS
jgi:hypothetical protein